MIFERAFPWRPHDFTALVAAFETLDKIEVKWYWEPFHAPGMRALKFAARKKFTPEQFEQILEHLSCPQAPPQFKKKLQNLGVCDESGRALPLDPRVSFRGTYFAAQRQVDVFENSFCPKIIDLRAKVGHAFRPEIIGTAEFTELSSWLTNRPEVLKRFHGSDEWKQIELIEVLFGVHKSSSSLHFSRIV